MIVAGFTYYEPLTRRGERPIIEIAIVGNGDRKHLDALVARAPEADRQVVVEFFKTFAENGRPTNGGMYTYRGENTNVVLIWWKQVTEFLC